MCVGIESRQNCFYGRHSIYYCNGMKIRYKRGGAYVKTKIILYIYNFNLMKIVSVFLVSHVYNI